MLEISFDMYSKFSYFKYTQYIAWKIVSNLKSTFHVFKYLNMFYLNVFVFHISYCNFFSIGFSFLISDCLIHHRMVWLGMFLCIKTFHLFSVSSVYCVCACVNVSTFDLYITHRAVTAASGDWYTFVFQNGEELH